MTGTANHTPPPEPAPEEGEVYVTPRYLAGTRWTGDPALAPLLELGWPHHHDELGNFYISSPDQTLRVGYLPEGENFGLWRIAAAPDPFAIPAWSGWFSDQAPEEIVHDLLTALAQDYQDDDQRHLTGPRQTVHAYAPLAEAGWRARFDGRIANITAPDAFARLSFHPRAADIREQIVTRTEITQAWWLAAGCDTTADWQATFTLGTPTHLLAAVTAAMANPAPVLRHPDQIPDGHRPHIRIRRVHQPALANRPAALPAEQAGQRPTSPPPSAARRPPTP